MRHILLLLSSFGLLTHAKEKPNIVLIYADDLGYGEASCYNPERNKVPTPHIDKLARQGMRFTDAHSSSAVCSPSRYTLLTGRYHWRSRLQQGIVGMWEKPLIAENRLTLASMLREQGYQTAITGKWHLGWDWNLTQQQIGLMTATNKNDVPASDEQIALWKDRFSRDIEGGPTDRGFDRYFGTDVPNWPPFCFIENRRTVGIPSEFLPAKLFLNQLASQQGPALKDWNLAAILPAITQHACDWIGEFAQNGKPFFLYLPMTAPHTPIAPNSTWKGKSGLGTYADFVMETDASIGRVLESITRAGIEQNTLVILTSDNGNASYAGGKDLEKSGHYVSGPLRGSKFDAWEGGHRVPFIVRWPRHVKAGSVCEHLVQQSDLMATLADILSVQLPGDAGEDSISMIPLLQGKNEATRTNGVSCAASGVPALRSGSWKYILGNPGRSPAIKKSTTEITDGYLYNLADDISESKNLAQAMPAKVAEMKNLLEKIITRGRSTTGPDQKNDVPVIRRHVR
ncbi:MAG: sulfatase family protein [Akkermansiaceae bacterium]